MIEALLNKPFPHPYGLRQGHPLGKSRGLVLCLPMWAGHGNKLYDMVTRSLLGTWSGPTWKANDAGPGVDFVSASNDTLYFDSPVTAPPFTVACWAMAKNVTDGHGVWSLSDSSEVDDQFAFYYEGREAGDPFRFAARGTGLAFEYTSGGTFISNAWYGTVAVAASTTSRSLYADGKFLATNTVARTVPGIDRLGLGYFSDSTPSNWLDGQIRLFMVWDQALTATEITDLAIDPFGLIRPPSTRLITWGAIQNTAPVVNDQTFSVAENSANGTVVDTVEATDADDDTLTYEITAGNTNSAFALHADTGVITVADSNELDFETTPQYLLTVKVTDDGYGARSDTATITINVTDVVEGETTNELLLKGYGT